MTAANGSENMMAQLVIYECVAHTFRHTHTRRHMQLQYINIEVLAVYQSVRRHKSTLNSKRHNKEKGRVRQATIHLGLLGASQ